MMKVLEGVAIIATLVGLGIVPPCDMPEDAEPATWAVEEVEAEEIEEPVEESEEEMTFLGYYDMTAYEWTGNPCANGNYPEVGYTVACNSLPLGTTVYIEGVGYRVVEDRGADWHGDNWMDLYLGDEASCYAWGVQTVAVYIVN